MAKKAMINKQQATPKYSTRRICFRELAHEGKIPGVKKASW